MSSPQYSLMIHFVHSRLQMCKNLTTVDENTTVDNFRTYPNNDKACTEIFESALNHFQYELSHNQMCNGINHFLKNQ